MIAARTTSGAGEGGATSSSCCVLFSPSFASSPPSPFLSSPWVVQLTLPVSESDFGSTITLFWRSNLHLSHTLSCSTNAEFGLITALFFRTISVASWRVMFNFRITKRGPYQLSTNYRWDIRDALSTYYKRLRQWHFCSFRVHSVRGCPCPWPMSPGSYRTQARILKGDLLEDCLL